MITEYHFPTPVYIEEIPNAVELNYYLTPQRWEDLVCKQELENDTQQSFKRRTSKPHH